jgi:hypothetical protein
VENSASVLVRGQNESLGILGLPDIRCGLCQIIYATV